MDRIIRVHSSNNYVNLWENSPSFLFASCHYMQGSYSLSIEPHILSKALCDDKLEALISEIPNSISVGIKIPCSITLIRTVKEWKKFSFSHNLRNLMPLLLAWVYTCRIMSAYMQQNNWSFFDWREFSHHTLKIKHSTFGLEVWVLISTQTGVA